MDKYLYFRGVVDEDNDDGQTGSAVLLSSIAIPARAITGIAPASDALVKISFESVRNQGPYGGHAGASGAEIIQDNIQIAVGTHTHQAVIDTIIRAITNTTHTDGFIDVVDDVVTNFAGDTISAVRLNNNISAMGGYTSDTNMTGISVAAAE